MKERIKKLLITGCIFIGATIVVLLLISIIRGIPLTLIKISNALFSEFLILLVLASFLAIKEEFLFKIKESKEGREKGGDNLNRGLELIIISLPIVIMSILITLI
ncbi:hypothetical protein BX659_102171 [Orenia metallireducens]|jgi:hypothetical protein|uniref:Uncharacterized protein n=1 Tax=Orenia metallireducens TaxID=1413210 RepID=A0A285F3J4_9FIRM|nr:hypothetical protein [Orenia metallireducens]PRX34855.1 hypothetical protein BX659_102171 [Orenia metallireducens]SNY05889.1 hypothetical protein SAMN06265827_101169 [Orenia metallireducens]